MACLRSTVQCFIRTSKKCVLTNKPDLRTLQARFICRKEHMDPDVVAAKPKPWPYERKKYTILHEILKLDRTIARFDENTKIITVDGLVGVGKEKFAAELADVLGMKLFQEPDIDALFIDHKGFDYRCFNHMLTEEAQFMDLKMLHENPWHVNTGVLQVIYLMRRSFHYLDALAHLYNTGQGIVFLRSPWSDVVFMEALSKHGYVYKDTQYYYWRMRRSTIWEYQRPHVQIYLDVKPEQALKNIRSKPNTIEAKSKLLNLEFLQTLEKEYKNLFLPEMDKHAFTLVYDWSEGGDMEMVVEDLEKLDFDQYEMKGERMEDWRLFPERTWNEYRRLYTNEKDDFYAKFILPDYDVEGMVMSDDSACLLRYLEKRHVPNWYDGPFDPTVHGILKTMFKTQTYREKQNNRWNAIIIDP